MIDLDYHGEIILTKETLNETLEFVKKYTHDGEELHFVIEGEIEYIVGDKTYKLTEGDSLWHKSNIPHGAGNTGSKKAKFITIGVPPTFM